jgi:thiamine-phosphate pyrophosphorylase
VNSRHAPLDYSLYLVTDSALSRGRSQLEIVAAAIRGGVTVVQYREKTVGLRVLIEQALALQTLCRQAAVPFIVNDRVDVALAVDADGVHVGQDDMPASLARQLIGPDRIVGVSVENIAQARQAQADGADYVGASPIFATPTKPDAPRPMGLEGLREVARVCSLPIVAIGGMNKTNAAEALRAGAAGIAVVSAIVQADDVERASRELKAVIERERGTASTSTSLANSV